ncbi:MAG: SDR family NAD(P)-dependent oxidoreductase, partial [Terrimesophilobacter sp.]
MGRLDGQSILLTGGGSGIGRAIALEYLRQGASVTVLERSAKNAESLRGESDERLEVLVGYATDAADLRSAVAACARRTGQIDNLTCCVGVFDFYVSVRTLGVEE